MHLLLLVRQREGTEPSLVHYNRTHFRVEILGICMIHGSHSNSVLWDKRTGLPNVLNIEYYK